MTSPTPKHGNGPTEPPAWGQPPQQLPPGPDGEQQQWGSLVQPPQQKQPWSKRKKITVGVLAFLAVSLIWGKVNPADPLPVKAAAVDTSSTTEPAAAPAKKKAPAKTEPVQVKKKKAPPKIVYKTVTSRQWKKIAKSPDAHIGEAIILYGQVVQADGATGDDVVRANVDGRVHPKEYGYVDYDINTILTAGKADFGDLVEDDLFKIKGVVTGGLDYESTLGGELTAPQVEVNVLKVTGSAE